MNDIYVERSPDYLEHHGILGQKWGIRRFQNPDGSLTEEGRKRYGDILTPDQMKNMIRSYNLRTGKSKKINKNTTFKTSHGTYDYKGRRIDTDTNVDDPGNKNKTDVKKKISEMTDEELAAATARQKAEKDYKDAYAKNNPAPIEKVSTARQMIDNLRSNLINDIPAGISLGMKNYLTRSIANLAGADSSKQQSKPKSDKPKQESQSKPKETESKPKENNNKPKEENKTEEKSSSSSNDSGTIAEQLVETLGQIKVSEILEKYPRYNR